MNAANHDQARVFAALGDGTRLELLARLSDNEDRSIAQLTSGLKLTRQAVTKHLRVLEEAKVVTSKRIGRESRFAIQKETLESAQDYLAHASAQWDEVIDRIKATVEK
ncbi:MAG: ArsR/SmtB family transcription factor [Woeseiaceae bacterium]